MGTQHNGIVAGPDGNVWFTEYLGNKVGRITTAGKIIEYAIPAPLAAFPFWIPAGCDGNLWFTEQSGNRIGQLVRAGPSDQGRGL